MTALNEKSITDRVRDYYRGERISNALLVLIGGAGLTWTFLLYLWRQGQFSTGLFYSTVPLASFLVITGIYRFVRSLKRYKLAQDEFSGEEFLKQDELPHLEGRLSRFLNKRKVDLAGILLGFLLVTFSILGSWNHIILGTSISLLSTSAVLLVFDLFGQFRTSRILHH